MGNKHIFYTLATVTLIGFTGLGFAIQFFWIKKPIIQLFTSNYSILLQCGVGLFYGLSSALLAILLIKSPILLPIKSYYGNMLQQLNLNFSKILIISLSAGIGEEILFRGGLQPLLGIWLTAIIFVAIHGYLNPFNWRISVYGIFMIIIIVGIGMIREKFGLLSAISAHFLIDVILLYYLTKGDPEDSDNNGNGNLEFPKE